MRHALSAGWLALIVLSMTANAAPAGSPVPEVHPQWMQGLSREVFSADTIRSPNGRTWKQLADGSRVLFTAMLDGDSEIALLARRFAEDGGLLHTRVLPGVQTGASSLRSTFVDQDPASGDILLLTGPEAVSNSLQRCVLLRLDATFGVKSTTPIGSELGDDKGCVGLQLLADGSTIVAFGAGLVRVDAAGNVVWIVNDGADDHYLKPRDMLLDTAGVLWIASRGGADFFEAAAVMRFDLAGQRLSEDVFLCTACTTSTARALLLFGDGSVMVGGSSEVDNQPGFIARYNADGERTLLHNAEANFGYTALVRDANGAVYAFAESILVVEKEVRRINSTDGTALWSEPANNFAAAANGIVATRRTSDAVTATAYNADGTQLWHRELAVPDGGDVSRGRLVDGRTELLLRDYSGQVDCGIGPQIVAIDATGTLDVLARPCLMPASTHIRSFDAAPGLGALAGVDSRLVAYTPDGDFRWEASLCPWCPTHNIVGAKLTPNGGAWGLDSDYETAAASLTRYDSGGQEVVSTPLEFLFPTSFELFGDDDQAVVVQTWSQTLTWQRLQASDGTLELREHQFFVPPFHIQNARGLPDGGVIVALREDDCAIMCPPMYYLAVVRLAADGSILWHYEAPEGLGWSALDGQGGTHLVVFGQDHLWRIRRVGPDGQVEPDAFLQPVDGSPTGLYGPFADRLLLAIEDSGSNVVLWSIDAAGEVLATRNFAAGMQVCDDSPFGLLIANHADPSSPMLWIDPVSLETRAQFRLDAEGAESCGNEAWRLLSDGSVYGADAHHDAWNLYESRLARFSAPGFVPTELIYRNNFD